MTDALTREDIETIRNFAGEPCECPVEVVCLEVADAACAPCKARKWLEVGVKLAEELS